MVDRILSFSSGSPLVCSVARFCPIVLNLPPPICELYAKSFGRSSNNVAGRCITRNYVLVNFACKLQGFFCNGELYFREINAEINLLMFYVSIYFTDDGIKIPQFQKTAL